MLLLLDLNLFLLLSLTLKKKLSVNKIEDLLSYSSHREQDYDMRSISCSSCTSLVSTANQSEREMCLSKVPSRGTSYITSSDKGGEAPLQTTCTQVLPHKARIQEESSQITYTYHRSSESPVLYQGVER